MLAIPVVYYRYRSVLQNLQCTVHTHLLSRDNPRQLRKVLGSSNATALSARQSGVLAVPAH